VPPSSSRIPRRGEIWLVTHDLDDHAAYGRPHLVISAPIVADFADELVVIPIWTNAPDAPTRVRLRAGTGGIRHDSVLMCDQLVRIDQLFVVGRAALGPLVSMDILKEAMYGVRLALGEPELVIEADRQRAQQERQPPTGRTRP